METGISTWAMLSQNTAGTHLLHTYREAANADSPSTLNESDSDWSDDYNAYANTLLGLNLIPATILAEQAAFYPTVTNTLGLPLDPETIGTSPDYTPAKADWEVWTAASFGSQSLSTLLIGDVYNYANTTTAGKTVPDLYDPSTSGYVAGFEARPVVGGVFAPLALALKRGQ